MLWGSVELWVGKGVGGEVYHCVAWLPRGRINLQVSELASSGNASLGSGFGPETGGGAQQRGREAHSAALSSKGMVLACPRPQDTPTLARAVVLASLLGTS